MTLYMKNGINYRPASAESMDLLDSLPVGNYTVQMDPFENFFLQKIESFSLPSKLYGTTERHTKRIMGTFQDRSGSTGVMLTGEKGSGKSLLAKNLSVELAKEGVPTIVINAPWVGDKFFKFIQDIEQPCVVLFDEFEKVYDRGKQESILTLLDGVFGSKKLYIITCNDKWRVDEHMRNRPGRIYYMIDFKGLDGPFIEEYCNDNLINTQYIPKIVSIASLYSEFNFDMLKALVEEMNRFDEPPQEALELLNAKPEFDNGSLYSIDLVYEGVAIPTKKLDSGESWKGNPLVRHGVNIDFYAPAEDDDGDDYKSINFPAHALVHVDAVAGKFTYEHLNSRLTLTRVKTVSFNYNAF